MNNYCIPSFEYCACHDKGLHVLTKYYSGWRRSKCKELSSIVGISIFTLIIIEPRSMGYFVGVRFCHPLFFMFGARKMHMFGDSIRGGGFSFVA